MWDVLDDHEVPIAVRAQFFLVRAPHGAPERGGDSRAQHHPGAEDYQKDHHTIVCSTAC